MNTILIIRMITYCISLLLVASLPFRIKEFKKKSGDCILPLKRSSSKLFIIPIFLCFVVVFLLQFRSFPLYVTIIIDVCAVLGIELCIRENVNRRFSGVYEHFLVTEGRLFYKDDIVAIPELDYEDGISTSYENTLKIVCEKSGEAWIAFDSGDEKKKALTILKSWV